MRRHELGRRSRSGAPRRRGRRRHASTGQRAVELEPGMRRTPGVAGAVASAAPRRGRASAAGATRRAAAAGRGRRPPPAVEPGDGWRSANRSPGAAAIGASRRIASDEPSGRSIASRGPRTTSAPTWAVPRWSRSRSRSAGGAGARPVASPRAAGSRRAAATVATTAGSRGQDACPRSRAVARRRRAGAPSGRRRPPRPRVPRTWTSRTRTVDARRARAAGSRPVDDRPPRRLPVTTVPRPLTVNTRSIGEPAPPPAGRPATPRDQRGQRALAASSMPSPVGADAASTGPRRASSAPRSRPTARARPRRRGRHRRGRSW